MNKLISIPSICITILIFFSCAKENNDVIKNNSVTQKLMIKVAGIESPIPNDDDAPSFIKKASNKLNSSENRKEIQQLGNINVETDFQMDHYGDEGTNINAQTNPDHTIKKLAAVEASQINPSIKYRFILFKKNTDNSYTYVGHKDATKQTAYEATAFEVLKGNTYKWVAYSYNTTDNINDTFNENSLVIETSINKDLLYAANEFVIPNNTPGVGEDIKIDILFQHRLARVAISLKANDFPAIIRNTGKLNFSAQLATNSQNYFSKGKLNLLNNSISDVNKVTFNGLLPFTTASNNVGDSTRTAYLYTSDFETKMPNITIKINYLMFQDIYTYPDENYPSIENREIIINSKNKTAAPGFSYSSSINFSNSEGVIKGDLIWARGNLSYDLTNDRYFIQRSPNRVRVRKNEDYWMYNSLKPWDRTITNDASHRGATWQTSKDPCRQVAGGWRLPTSAEFLTLGGISTPERNRRPNILWNNEVAIGKIGAIGVSIRQNSYTSFRGDDGQWVTIFNTAAFITRYDNTNYIDWTAYLDNSALFMVNDGDGNGGAYKSVLVEGAQNYFKTRDLPLSYVIPVRCVKDRI